MKQLNIVHLCGNVEPCVSVCGFLHCGEAVRGRQDVVHNLRTSQPVLSGIPIVGFFFHLHDTTMFLHEKEAVWDH